MTGSTAPPTANPAQTVGAVETTERWAARMAPRIDIIGWYQVQLDAEHHSGVVSSRQWSITAANALLAYRDGDGAVPPRGQVTISSIEELKLPDEIVLKLEGGINKFTATATLRRGNDLSEVLHLGEIQNENDDPASEEWEIEYGDACQNRGEGDSALGPFHAVGLALDNALLAEDAHRALLKSAARDPPGSAIDEWPGDRDARLIHTRFDYWPSAARKDVRFEIFRANLPQVPSVGEQVNLKGNPYIVHARGWAIGDEDGNDKLYAYVGVFKAGEFARSAPTPDRAPTQVARVLAEDGEVAAPERPSEEELRSAVEGFAETWGAVGKDPPFDIDRIDAAWTPLWELIRPRVVQTTDNGDAEGES